MSEIFSKELTAFRLNQFISALKISRISGVQDSVTYLVGACGSSPILVHVPDKYERYRKICSERSPARGLRIEGEQLS